MTCYLIFYLHNMENNFEKLIKEVRDNNYIEIKDGAMHLSFKNVQKLKDKGFDVSEDVIDKLMDAFHDEKFEEAKKKHKKEERVKKYVGKPLTMIVQIILLILFMLLIYFLTPSLKENFGDQDRDESDLYQSQYRR